MQPVTATPYSSAWRWASRPGKGGQQAGVDVEDPLREGADQDSATAGACNRPDTPTRRRAPRSAATIFVVVRLAAGLAAVRQQRGREPELAGGRESRRASARLLTTSAISAGTSPSPSRRGARGSWSRAPRGGCRRARSSRALDSSRPAPRRDSEVVDDARAARLDRADDDRIAAGVGEAANISSRAAASTTSHHADAHVEDAQHLVGRDRAELAERAEERRASPSSRAGCDRACRRAGRAAGCR